jgi:hypothetical protein
MTTILEQRLHVMEDVLAITELKARYCVAADCGWDRPLNDADGMAALFVPDGVWEAGGYGRAEGREAIRELFKSSLYPFGFHTVSNPDIKVSGDTATGKWHMLVAHIVDGHSSWLGAIHNDEYVRTPEGWRLKTVKVTIAFTGDQPWEVVK